MQLAIYTVNSAKDEQQNEKLQIMLFQKDVLGMPLPPNRLFFSQETLFQAATRVRAFPGSPGFTAGSPHQHSTVSVLTGLDFLGDSTHPGLLWLMNSNWPVCDVLH